MISGKVLAGCVGDIFHLRLTGDVRLPWCVTLENYCDYVFQKKEISSMRIDLCGAENLDSTTLGILAKIGQTASAKLGSKPEIFLTDSSIQRLLLSMGFEALFNITASAPDSVPDLPVLPLGETEESDIQDSVIDAHRALMDMNKQNTRQFENLVDTLERARDGEASKSPAKD
ncbi:MAG: anti-anti-sigma factor [Gammaproteobacteria bacterium]|nr:anti-anti-sigma factor [Gammaproteobacteria bacterium]NND39447.1 anti-anti-sigma factor [Pseudomonadales bacterium]MBT8150947.1 anti-anti-sigma factor [Gammaproteobacteria bacterium]NNL11720.1 anti-anti-sigma factor [Pseudomonadales bacterium]NNM12260.1 anti-anti-sigma factor [Pseudomonadales bacterium]